MGIFAINKTGSIMSRQRIVILGGNADIAKGYASQRPTADTDLVLVSQNAQKLESTRQEMVSRGYASVETISLDLTDASVHQELIEKLFQKNVSVLLVAFGVLGDCDENWRNCFETNAIHAISLLMLAKPFFEKQKSGVLAVITSVAGDRGKASNYIYGASKKAVSVVLDGLRQVLYPYGVHVLDVRPGFVKTKMTEHMKSNGMLWATPEKVGKDIHRAILKKTNILYTPWFWCPIMIVFRNIPTSIFKRLNL